VRVPVTGERALWCVASSGHPALLARGMVPVDEGNAGVCFSRATTVVGTIESAEALGTELEAEVVPRVLA
jgi:hypothetical protein